MVRTRRQDGAETVEIKPKSKTANATEASLRAKQVLKERRENQALQLASARISQLGKRKEAEQLSEQQSKQKFKAQTVLSEKMSHVASARWIKSRTAKSRTVKASEIRSGPRNQKVLRKSVSVQVDSSKKEVAQLQADKEALLQRLVEPKSRKKCLRKPLTKCARTASLSKIDEIAKYFRSKDGEPPSYQELQNSFQILQKRLGIIMPVQPSTHRVSLSPMEDVRLCSGKLSGQQRRDLKSALGKLGKDMFAPTEKVKNLVQEISSELQFQSAKVTGASYMWLSNVKEVLEKRLIRLQESNKLDFSGHFNNKLFLVLLGDKGGATTKIAIGVGNIRKANSANNLLLIAAFDDDDAHFYLRNLEQLFLQLDFTFVSGHEVVWYVTGDVKFLSGIYGHLGASSTHPCVLCNSPKESLQIVQSHQERTWYSIEQSFLKYVFFTQDRPELSAKEKLLLHRGCKSIAKQPLVKIPISNIIPPSLHIIQGLCQNVISWIEKAEPGLVKNLEVVYRSLGAKKQAWYQSFTGNHCRKLLFGDGPNRIASVISCNSKHSAFRSLLVLLGQMQSMSKASFLRENEIVQFEKWSQDFFTCLKQNFPNTSITPKCHMLCCHVKDFMKLHNFWGMLSEQSIESLHRIVNGDERRFSSLGSREKTLQKIIQECYVRNVVFDLGVEVAGDV